MRISLIVLSLTALFVSCVAPVRADANADFRILAADYLAARHRLDPETAMYDGDNRFNDRLTTWPSDEYHAANQRLLESTAQRLSTINVEQLDRQNRISAQRLQFDMSIDIRMYKEGVRQAIDLMATNSYTGLHQAFAQWGAGQSVQPFVTEQDHEAWLSRARDSSRWVDLEIAALRRGIETGYVLPRPLAENMLPQLKAHAEGRVEDSVFWAPVVSVADVSLRARLEPQYRDVFDNSIRPGYARLHDFVATEYLAHTRSSVGRYALPNGKRLYEFDILRHTTLERTAEQIHAIGLEQVAELHAAMNSVRINVGFDGDLAAWFRHLRTSRDYQFRSAESAMNAYTALKGVVDQRSRGLFKVLPTSDYEVRPVPEFMADGAASASYVQPSPDGSRPGVFELNALRLDRLTTYEVTALSLHEAVPGHHLQSALALEDESLPDTQRFGWITAYGEGWALYAETLGIEMALYDEPMQYFGFLYNRLYRAIRLVVDTGLHADGWSREYAIQWFLDNSPMPEDEARAEVERYIADPGQALAYLTGAMEIERLREKAHAALGERFDLAAFHHEVLRDGTVPLPLLAEKIDAWIAAQVVSRDQAQPSA